MPLPVRLCQAQWRRRAHDEPGWCPALERQREQERARIELERAAKRVVFRQYATDYLEWARLCHRGWRTEDSRVNAMVEAFGDTKLDALTTADVDRFLERLLDKRSAATRNRYRTTLHAMLNRAIRHGLLAVNPVKDVTKAKEPEGRTLFLASDEEVVAVLDQLSPRNLSTGMRHVGTRV